MPEIWEIPESEYIACPGENAPDEEWHQCHLRRREWEYEMVKALTRGDISQEAAHDLGYYASSRCEEWKRLPPILYHVTMARSFIEEDGFKSRYELGATEGTGLGGGPNMYISFSTNYEISKSICNGLTEMRRVVRGEFTVQDMMHEAEDGLGAKRPFWNDIVKHWESQNCIGDDPYAVSLMAILNGRELSDFGLSGRPDDEDQTEWVMYPGAYRWTGGDGRERCSLWHREATDYEIVKRAVEFYKRFSFHREKAGGWYDPLFFCSNSRALAEVPEEDIALFQVRSKPYAMGHQASGMEEWRIADGSVVVIENVEQCCEILGNCGGSFLF